MPPHYLADLILQVEVRGPDQGLSDDPTYKVLIASENLRKDTAKGIERDLIRSHHISFEAFCRRVEKISNVKFDPVRDEMAWIDQSSSPGTHPRYAIITNEELFQNAVGVMVNRTTITEPLPRLTFHIFSPAPREAVFRRSRRAADTLTIRHGEAASIPMPQVLSSNQNLLQPATPSILSEHYNELQIQVPPMLSHHQDDLLKIYNDIFPCKVQQSQSRAASPITMESLNEDQRPMGIDRNDDARDDEDPDIDEDWDHDNDWDRDENEDHDENRDHDEDGDNNGSDDGSSNGFILRAGTALGQLSTKDIECGPQEPGESDEAYQQRVQDAKDLKADLEASKLVSPLHQKHQ